MENSVDFLCRAWRHITSHTLNRERKREREKVEEKVIHYTLLLDNTCALAITYLLDYSQHTGTNSSIISCCVLLYNIMLCAATLLSSGTNTSSSITTLMISQCSELKIHTVFISARCTQIAREPLRRETTLHVTNLINNTTSCLCGGNTTCSYRVLWDTFYKNVESCGVTAKEKGLIC